MNDAKEYSMGNLITKLKTLCELHPKAGAHLIKSPYVAKHLRKYIMAELNNQYMII